MRYLLPLFECEIETMMLKTKYYRKKDYFYNHNCIFGDEFTLY